MRQIIMLVAVGGSDFSWQPGQVVELPDDEAEVWADGVRARYLEPGDFVLQHQALTEGDVEALKARFLEGVGQPAVVLEPTGTPPYVFDILAAWATGEPLDFGGHDVPEDVQARIAEVLAGQAGPADEEPPPRAGTGSGRDAWAAYAERHQVPVTAEMKRDDIIAACDAAQVPTSKAEEA